MIQPLKIKIPDNDLREFVGGKQRGVRSVIVEVASTAKETAPRRRQLRPKPVKPVQRLAIRVADAKPKEPRMNEFARVLRGLALKETPTRLDAAHAFALKVDARQLKAIAENPSVEVIRPNRVHRVHTR